MQRTRWASKGVLSGGSHKFTSRDPVVLGCSRSRVVAFQTFPMTQRPSAGWWLAKVGEQHSCHHENGQAAGWLCHRAVELAETCNTSESLGVVNLDSRFRLSQTSSQLDWKETLKARARFHPKGVMKLVSEKHNLNPTMSQYPTNIQHYQYNIQQENNKSCKIEGPQLVSVAIWQTAISAPPWS